MDCEVQLAIDANAAASRYCFWRRLSVHQSVSVPVCLNLEYY